jgi:hypothetical protein
MEQDLSLKRAERHKLFNELSQMDDSDEPEINTSTTIFKVPDQTVDEEFANSEEYSIAQKLIASIRARALLIETHMHFIINIDYPIMKAIHIPALISDINMKPTKIESRSVASVDQLALCKELLKNNMKVLIVACTTDKLGEISISCKDGAAEELVLRTDLMRSIAGNELSEKTLDVGEMYCFPDIHVLSDESYKYYEKNDVWKQTVCLMGLQKDVEVEENNGIKFIKNHNDRTKHISAIQTACNFAYVNDMDVIMFDFIGARPDVGIPDVEVVGAIIRATNKCCPKHIIITSPLDIYQQGSPSIFSTFEEHIELSNEKETPTSLAEELEKL